MVEWVWEVDMKCDKCNHEWVAISPLGTQELECPSCHEMVALAVTQEEAIRNFNRAILASPLREDTYEA